MTTSSPVLNLAVQGLPVSPAASPTNSPMGSADIDNREWVVYIDLNTMFHFEVTLSIAHLFRSGSLPHMSDMPAWCKAGHPATSIYFNPKFVTDERRRILQNDFARGYGIQIGVPKRCDVHVIVSVYGNRKVDASALSYPQANFPELQNDSHTLLICHEVDDTGGFDGWDNVYYLAPHQPRWFLPTIFPFPRATPDVTQPPVFLVQGSMDPKRRNYYSLVPLLQAHTSEFTIKLLGGSAKPDADGARRAKGNLPECLQPYSNKIQLCSGLDDEAYHNELQDCAFILPLVDETTDPHYFTHKLCSSVSYGISFGLKFLTHQSLKDSYPMISGWCYHDEQTFVQAFGDALASWAQ